MYTNVLYTIHSHTYFFLSLEVVFHMYIIHIVDLYCFYVLTDPHPIKWGLQQRRRHGELNVAQSRQGRQGRESRKNERCTKVELGNLKKRM